MSVTALNFIDDHAIFLNLLALRATPEQAEEVHLDLRNILKECYNGEVAETVRIQYGGSVKPDNAAELLSQPNIDGALVGGASLKVDQFMGIIDKAV